MRNKNYDLSTADDLSNQKRAVSLADNLSSDRREQRNDLLLRIPDQFLSASSAARMLGISRRRLYRLVEKNRIVPDGFVEGEFRFRFSNLESYVVNGLPGHLGRSHDGLHAATKL